MKESVEEYYYPCRKHPSSSPVGVCAYCLKDRLMKLVCSDCGEQRLSSCSCSDVSSYRNSSCTVDVGSVGRISFLIENEKADELFSQSKDDAFVLKRSNSCVVEVKKKKKNNGFWRIGKLFRKKERNIDGLGFDESWGAMDVSRCRSVCSFRGDHDSEMAYNSSAKISDFNESEPRKSGFRMDLESSAKESDDSGFIDLNLDESKTQHFVFKNPSSSSCRITVNERGIKKGSKGHGKVWKWIFKQHSAGKKDLHHIFESSSRSDR